MPNKFPRRSLVSAPTVAALQELQTQIEAAEKLLAKLPGSTKSHVSLDDIFCFNETSGQTYLKFHFELVTQFESFHAGHEPIVKRLVDYPTVTRIYIAKRIPELISLAKTAEAEIAKDALDTAAAIEQAIAQHME